MPKPSRRTRQRYTEEFKYDPNPLYCPHNPAAFDPRYGPETDEQIEWHVNHKTPGAEKWEVGVPAKPFDRC